jgi:uncharacterized protein (TIGR03905 family)
MHFEIDGNIVKNVKIIGGCPGNSFGVALLCKDKTIDEVIKLLSGINCKERNTSCPDQLAKALMKYKEKRR